MPLSELYVEGKLDAEVLLTILKGRPAVKRRGSKTGLAAIVREGRELNQLEVAYLRDRDFDFWPPEDTETPTVDKLDGSGVLGWRWCRHEMENYLLDPAIVTAAISCDRDEYEYEHSLMDAGQRILSYQVARWVIGITRSNLPPNYKLSTRPNTFSRDQDFRLPDALDTEAINKWVLEHLSKFATPVVKALSNPGIELLLTKTHETMTSDRLTTTDQVLLWCGGKDLMASLTPWIETQNIDNPGQFRSLVRDWITTNPSKALDLLPEWQALVNLVQN